MEQDGTETAGVTRSQNAVYVLPPDWARSGVFLAPALERLDAAEDATQLLIVTGDTESAAALAAAAHAEGHTRGLSVLAATSSDRAARLLRDHATQIVAGDPAALVALLQRSALKPARVRQVVIAWLDETIAAHQEAVETLLGEVPRDAARTVVVREVTPAVEQFVERYARRARRVGPGPSAGEEPAPTAIQYVAVPDAVRPTALRRLLDALDPASGFVFARTADSRRAVEGVLAVLGYPAGGLLVAGETMDDDTDTLVLYDLPATRAELAGITGGHAAGRVVALVQPRQLSALRALAGGLASPFVFPDTAERAREREARVRARLREVLASGAHAREVLALEPLLAEYDGIEIAAAALRLLEAEERRVASTPSPAPARMTRVFVNVGQTDGVRPGDLVGLIANTTGLSGRDVGRVELRERHALVEVPDGVAADVAAKLTGLTLRGRQVVARLDQNRPPRAGHGGRTGGARRPHSRHEGHDR